MERDWEPLAARPALETEGLRFLHVTVGSLLATHLQLVHRLQLHPFVPDLAEAFHPPASLEAEAAGPSRLLWNLMTVKQEALEAARPKMQEELNAQLQKHKENTQLEEKEDSMREGKSYKGNARKPQVPALCRGRRWSLLLETWRQGPHGWWRRPRKPCCCPLNPPPTSIPLP
ncbi:LOW QUALITY PROTEIN: selenoprotein S-like [Glossophaga mutica]